MQNSQLEGLEIISQTSFCFPIFYFSFHFIMSHELDYLKYTWSPSSWKVHFIRMFIDSFTFYHYFHLFKNIVEIFVPTSSFDELAPPPPLPWCPPTLLCMKDVIKDELLSSNGAVKLKKKKKEREKNTHSEEQLIQSFELLPALGDGSVAFGAFLIRNRTLNGNE